MNVAVPTSSMKSENENYGKVKIARDWMYFLIGGIYTSSDISKQRKYLWLGFNCAMTCLSILAPIGYICTSNSPMKPLDAAAVIWPACNTVFMNIAIPLITAIYRKKFEELFKFFKKNSNSYDKKNIAGEENAEELFKRRPPLEQVASWLKLIFGVALAYYLLPAINVLLFAGERKELFRNIQNHFIGVPYVDRISSTSLYWGLYAFEALFFLTCTLPAYLESSFHLIIAYELNHIAVDHCGQLKLQMDSIVSKISTSEQIPEKVYNDFENYLKEFIRKYSELRRSIYLVRPYVGLFCAALLSNIFFVLCSFMFIILSTDLEMFLKLKLFTGSVVVVVYLYPHCKFGSVVDSINDAIFQQVYDLPWYYMPPRRRKIVLIFLNLTLRPIIIKAFWTLPVNIAVLPKVLRLAYSVVNVLSATLK